MAQKRMLDKKISVSEQVANLTTPGKLLFSWMILHADDMGILPYSARSVKALVVPMVDDLSVEDIGKLLEDIGNQGLTTVFQHEEEKYILINSFYTSQTQKKDRDPQTLLKYAKKKSSTENWKTLETIVFRKEAKEGKEVKEGGVGETLTERFANIQRGKEQIGQKNK